MKGNALVQEILQGITRKLEKETPIKKEDTIKPNEILAILNESNVESHTLRRLMKYGCSVSVVLVKDAKEWLDKEALTQRIDSKEMDKEHIKEKRKVITEKDVLEIAGKVNELHLSKDTIITPLAKDCAKEKHIILRKG